MSADSEGNPQIVLHLVSNLKVGGIESQLCLVCSHYVTSAFPIQRTVSQYQDLFAEIQDLRRKPN